MPHARFDIIGETFTAVDFAQTRRFELPCVYLMAHESRQTPGAFYVHYAGQTHCLRDRFARHHQAKAAMALGARHVLVLVVQCEAHRRALEVLLRWEIRPKLNEEDVPRHIQAWRAAQLCGKFEIAARAKAAHMSGANFVLQRNEAARVFARIEAR